jgi:large subunit ribosomal protein L17
MRHNRRRGRLGLVDDHRTALLRNLARSVMTRQQIVTTHAKAKETSRFVDQLVTIAKGNSLHARRQLIRQLGSGSERFASLMIDTIAPKFSDRKGGYTRVLRYKKRAGDGAEMSLLEFTVPVIKQAPKKPKKKKLEAKPADKKTTKSDESPKTEQTEKKTMPEKGEHPQKETPKKGGFLGSLRRFLKGDDESK